MGEGFCRPARQKIAGILDVFQDFLTQQGGKRPDQAAFNACEYRFLKEVKKRKENWRIRVTGTIEIFLGSH